VLSSNIFGTINIYLLIKSIPSTSGCFFSSKGSRTWYFSRRQRRLF